MISIDQGYGDESGFMRLCQWQMPFLDEATHHLSQNVAL
jgi:hypothetical protein